MKKVCFLFNAAEEHTSSTADLLLPATLDPGGRSNHCLLPSLRQAALTYLTPSPAATKLQALVHSTLKKVGHFLIVVPLPAS
jgi:hypothetical protein